MSPARLLHTSAIRLALRYALLYTMLTGLGLAFLYWTTSKYIDAQFSASLEQELHDLQRLQREQGTPELQRILRAWVRGAKDDRRFFLLVSADGRHLAGDFTRWPTDLAADGQVRHYWIGKDLLPGIDDDEDDDKDSWPVLAARLPGGERLLIAESFEHAEDLQEYMLASITVILGVSVVLAVTMGIFLGHNVLRRIDVINDTARAVMDGNLSRRVLLDGREDEFHELSRHLNAMLDRIEQLLAGMRQVTDNVAHDLRQPLSRLRSRLEVTLMGPRSLPEYRATLRLAIADVDELLHTFNALLQIAQVEARAHRGDWEEVDLSALATKLGELYRDQAEAQGLKLNFQIQPGVTLQGNRHLIAQALSNLLENAIKFTPGNGHVTLRVSHTGPRAYLVVEDDGPGIPEDQIDSVLKRFVRLDGARSTSGNGLGLSLVKAVAELHSLRLMLEDNRPGLRVSLVGAAPV